MGMVNLILIVESIRSIATHNPDEDTTELHIPSLAAVGVALRGPALGVATESGLTLDLRSDQAVPLFVLLRYPETLESGAGPVGGPQERSLCVSGMQIAPAVRPAYRRRLDTVTGKKPRGPLRAAGNELHLDSFGIFTSAAGAKIIWFVSSPADAHIPSTADITRLE